MSMPERWDITVRDDADSRSLPLYVERRPGNIFVADFQGENYVVQYCNGEPYIDLGTPMNKETAP